MRIEKTNRADQKGFFLRPKKGSYILAFHIFPRWNGLKNEKGFLFSFNVGPGAGYMYGPNYCLRGYTFFLGWKARGGHPLYENYQPVIPSKVRLGITSNFQKVPYHFS